MTSSEHLDPAEPEVASIPELVSYQLGLVSFLTLATKEVLINEYTVVVGWLKVEEMRVRVLTQAGGGWNSDVRH